MADDEYEWEYEYEKDSMETFLVDVDLTTVNRNFKPTTQNRNKRLLDVSNESFRPTKKNNTGASEDNPLHVQTTATSNQTTEGNEAQLSVAPADQDAAKDTTPSKPAADDDMIPVERGLQTQDLHTENPLILYNGQVFSCTWSDLIGTTMYFSEPRETWLYDPDISTDAFDLVGLSRIKLVGREANVTPVVRDPKARTLDGHAPGHVGSSVGTIRRGNAKLNADLRKQVSFLEQLMMIKKNRGDKDNVHVVMNNKIAQSMAEGQLKDNLQTRGSEIEELNRRVVNGDAKALKELEEIYCSASSGQIDNDNDKNDDLDLPGDPNISIP